MRRYRHLKFFQHGSGRHLGFVRTVGPKLRRSIRRPRKLYPRTNLVDRITLCRDMAIRLCWGYMEPPFGGKGGRKGSAMVPLERAMVVSYRLSIVTVALSVTIRPQFAIECLRLSFRVHVKLSYRIVSYRIRRLKSTGRWVTLGPNLGGVPLGADPSCWVCKE